MDILKTLEAIVGKAGMLTGEDVLARPNQAWGLGQCPALAILRPKTTEEVSAIMQACSEAGQVVVPWGGLSGLVNGISCEPGDIVVSLERMNAIEALDADAGVMHVQAGAILQNVQEAAADLGWQFAVDLGARGSAQVGGLIATNAGGNSVVRYGMMREQVLGLEVVLADGRVMTSLNEVIKNNTGYDLKHLFVGSEGTLGIVTRAVLRLRPAPSAKQTAFVALSDFQSVITLLRRLGSAFEGKLSSFEVMWASHYKLLVEESERHQSFLPADYPYYVLLETEGNHPQKEEALFTEVLSGLMEEGLVVDAVIAQSVQQTQQLWEMRDDVEALVHALFPLAPFDVSLPLRHMEEYVSAVESAVAQHHPESRVIVFGHLGDGNIHLVVGPIEDKAAVEDLVYGELRKLGGSVSAEHGIGLDKRGYLSYSRSDVEIELMKSLKQVLDPQGLLNPGKIFAK